MFSRIGILRRERPLLRLLPYLSRYRTALILGSGMVLLTNLAAVCSPWVLREATNALQTAEVSASSIARYALLIIGLSIVEGLFLYGMRQVMIGVSRRIEYDLRNDLYRHLQSLPAAYFQANPTGDLMARATNDLSAVRSVLGPGIMYSVNTFFNVVLTVSVLLSVSPRLAILTLIPLGAVTFSVKYFGRRIHERFETIQEQFSGLTTLAQENVAGIRVVKAYHQEEAFLDRFRIANQEYFHRNLGLIRIWGAFQPLLTLLLGLSLVGLLFFGGRQVVDGTITLGDFVAFIAYLARLTWPTIALGFVINLFERGSASMGRINAILDTRSDIVDDHPDPVTELHGQLEFRNLSFSYGDKEVLSGVSFRIGAGETLAIVGRTGSGKSTLVHLLARIHPVPDGRIFIDGTDINRIPLAVLRRSIGFAPQDAFLFSDTIRRNIAFGRPLASEDEVMRAAATSNILPDVLELPDGFETFVGERGITLSGGQKQRVTISRAVLVDPKILILDDSLSAVDTETEEKILQELASHLENRTAILISHRVSTVKMADRIIVLDGGRVVEEGRHDELLAKDGYYADLHRRQLLQEELDVTP